MMLVSMIKTFNEDHRAGCEDVELAPLQYTTYELQPLGQSQQVLVLQCLFASRCSGFQLKACTFSHSWPSSRTNRQRMLVVTTLAPPTAGERVARRNRQRTLVVTTLAPPMRGHRGFLLEVPSHAGKFSPRAANPTSSHLMCRAPRKCENFLVVY